MSLKNLLIWYAIDENNVPTRITQLIAIPEKYDIDAYFERWRVGKPGVRSENYYTYVKTYLIVPEHIQGVEGVGYLFYAEGKPIRAVLPYFVTIKEDIDVEG